MQAGLLKDWITIQDESKERTPSGSIKRVWKDIYKKRARVIFKDGKEGIASFEATHNISITVMIRYQKGINRNMRLIWNDEKYNIESVNRDRGQMSLVLKCELIND